VTDAPARSLFVTGRLCLVGEHSDWAGGHRGERADAHPGYCLITGTDQGIEAVAEPATGVLRFEGPDGADASYPLGALERHVGGGAFHRFQIGVALALRSRYADVRGLALRVTRADLPVRKGLSSSAAACVLMARAYSGAYDLRLSLDDEMDLAYLGERMTGSECGRMDQACAFGRVPTFLTFDGDAMTTEAVRPGGAIHVVIVDLRRGKDTARILHDLNLCFTERDDAVARGVREALGPMNEACVRDARRLLEAGDAEGLGRLMTERQEAFDRLVAPACPAELTSPRLHEVLAHPPLAELTFGAKGVGSQGDGCAPLVARGPDEQAELLRTLPDALGVDCIPLTIEPAGGREPSGG